MIDLDTLEQRVASLERKVELLVELQRDIMELMRGLREITDADFTKEKT